ncbi:sugar transferase [Ligilactobacillus salivarius]|uniref:Sugar transferase n=1 Tax=Ligilactobacillus salivarius TaxID=1624 RepID=A0A1V9TTE4_9LACO|nr:sugar transferase [Ligilactobacillus salivarius]EFK79115.1 bacterial sugar transferase [Ligilactobacillus salivarius ACS-116-V-Col5a]MYY76569.1 sugar transferase [Ligilactobacillus salivarius]MYZ62294.1 sugar transferase [Ligilactobacillus salivarius]OQQ92977.1 sugar transferase [Ligilactobacillus salivarius]OQR12035.1 sugar transferase [Ligilactobacillus salivarius]
MIQTTTIKPKGFYERYIKRLQAIVLSLIAIIILSPILLITYLLVRVKFGKPAIFIQKRVGKDGKVFDLYKFRTMTNQRDEDGKLLPDDQRLTSFGKKLRSTSLDELPELFNVLKGDMALIGPRPLLVKYLPLYNDEQARRHEVRPGLTGYAQVNGRNTITWEDRLKLDVEYVDNVTFLNDWKIIFKTIKTVFKREGISEKGSATMDEFKGNGHRV